MKQKNKILAAVLLCGAVGLGSKVVFGQGTPGGGSSGAMPGQAVPQPGPTTPREVQPTIPGQPAPGLPQSQPLPGRPGTIPEQIEPPDAGSQRMVVSPDNIKSAQQALQAQGFHPGINGQMDAKTQEALRDFQKAHDLPATGVLDQKTATKLGVKIDEQERSTPLPREESTTPRSSGSMR
jgi:hypothetical protein